VFVFDQKNEMMRFIVAVDIQFNTILTIYGMWAKKIVVVALAECTYVSHSFTLLMYFSRRYYFGCISVKNELFKGTSATQRSQSGHFICLD